jgi:hypothetical protein
MNGSPARKPLLVTSFPPFFHTQVTPFSLVPIELHGGIRDRTFGPLHDLTPSRRFDSTSRAMQIEIVGRNGSGANNTTPVSVRSSGIPRARRYEIQAMVRYRASGEREWQNGVLENISISGVLFRASRSLYLDATIEMRFYLPIELNGESAAEVFCRGSVVRFIDCERSGGDVSIAARLDHSRFLRPMQRKRG